MENLKKQTVYLPVNINDEFWQKWDNGEKPDYDLADIDTGENVESWVNEKEGYFFTPEQLNEYTANVIKQALETAAKKAECCEDAIVILGHTITEAYVKKQSITNTLEEVYQKLKV